MKKIVLAISFVAITLFATAQKKGLTGHWVLTGDLGFTSSSLTNGQTTVDVAGVGNDLPGATQTSITVVPIVGTFVAPLSLVGLGIGYTGVNNLYNADGVKANSWVIEPLFRQYFPCKGGGHFFFYGQVDVPILPGTVNVGGAKTSGTTWGVEVRPGITYLLSDHWLIEANVGLIGYDHCLNPVVNSLGTSSAINASVNGANGNYTNNFNFGVFSGVLHSNTGGVPAFGQLTFGITHLF